MNLPLINANTTARRAKDLHKLHGNTGENNGMWKGNNVGYNALHGWLRRNLPVKKLCEICHKVPPHDIANKSGNYLRDFTDWHWLCRHCHMISDGRMYNLKQYQQQTKELTPII